MNLHQLVLKMFTIDILTELPQMKVVTFNDSVEIQNKKFCSIDEYTLPVLTLSKYHKSATL